MFQKLKTSVTRETDASWFLSTNTLKEPLKKSTVRSKWRTWEQGHKNGPLILESIISLPPKAAHLPMFQSYNTVCLPLLLIPALLVSFVKIISWIASSQRRSSHSAVPSDTFSSAKVNLLTGKVPGQTLQTGLINRNLAVLKVSRANTTVMPFADFSLKNICRFYEITESSSAIFLELCKPTFSRLDVVVYLISMSHIKTKLFQETDANKYFKLYLIISLQKFRKQKSYFILNWWFSCMRAQNNNYISNQLFYKIWYILL